MQQFNAGDRDGSTIKILNTEHRPDATRKAGFKSQGSPALENKFHEEAQTALHNCAAYDLATIRMKICIFHMQHFLWL
jgi:hypothetical protein